MATTSKVERVLSDKINKAIRTEHGASIPVIMDRVQLALPPNANDPSQYVTGLFYTAVLYDTFESLWDELLDRASREDVSYETSVENAWRDTVENPRSVRRGTLRSYLYNSSIHQLLDDCRIEGLARAGAIKKDIVLLTGLPMAEIERRMEDIAQHGQFSQYIKISRANIRAKPHVLLGYSWCLYMALFAGGRFVRDGVMKRATETAPGFWDKPLSELRPTSIMNPQVTFVPKPLDHAKDVEDLEFWQWRDGEDGADIKDAFKECFAGADSLEDNLQADVLEDSVHAMRMILAMVSDLDVVMQAQATGEETMRMLDDDLKKLKQTLPYIEPKPIHGKAPYARGFIVPWILQRPQAVADASSIAFANTKEMIHDYTLIVAVLLCIGWFIWVFFQKILT